MDKKRFVYTRDNVDNFLTSVIDITEEKLLSQGDVINLLNELYEDNRQLEVLLQETEEENDRLKKSNKLLMESVVEHGSKD